MLQPSRPVIGITSQRISRLYRLLQFLAAQPRTRPALLRRLKLDIRGFYRDLEKLREFAVPITFHQQKYHLGEALDAALARLPCPDPGLSFHEAIVLSKGTTAAHRKLKHFVASLKGKSR